MSVAIVMNLDTVGCEYWTSLWPLALCGELPHQASATAITVWWLSCGVTPVPPPPHQPAFVFDPPPLIL